jgi:hypothetical protein
MAVPPAGRSGCSRIARLINSGSACSERARHEKNRRGDTPPVAPWSPVISLELVAFQAGGDSVQNGKGVILNYRDQVHPDVRARASKQVESGP